MRVPSCKEFEGVDQKTYDLFCTYHLAHPDIWKAFQAFAIQMYKSGRRRYSAKTIMERIRWEYELRHADEFKINNDFTSLYARTLMRKYFQFRGFFELREIKGLRRAA